MLSLGFAHIAVSDGRGGFLARDFADTFVDACVSGLFKRVRPLDHRRLVAFADLTLLTTTKRHTERNQTEPPHGYFAFAANKSSGALATRPSMIDHAATFWRN